MPTVPKGSKILVTSGSGLVGSWVVNVALRHGYKVRTSVRSVSKGEYLKELFEGKYGSGKFEYVIVEDLEKAGAFDGIVGDVDAVIHTGSPFHFNIEGDPYKLVNPALNGTTNVLKSVLAHGKDVKRVVVTSSVAAVQDTAKPPGYVYNVDSDWNESDVTKLEKDPKSLNGLEAYKASKSLAEKASWELLKGSKIDLATVNPTLVIGPIIHQVTGPDSLNTSSKAFYEFYAGNIKDTKTYSDGVGGAVDVRDVAEIHVRALEVEEAAGNRWPAVWGPYSYQSAADVVHKGPFPEDVKKRILVGKPGTSDVSQVRYTDGKKAEKLLGRPVLDFEQQLLGTFESYADYEKRGWKGLPDQKLLDL